MKKVVYLSGGVGGAKFAKGLSKLKNIDLSIIVNTGDDEYIHGVALSPDIDSVIYGLANIEGKFGWGILNDKFTVNDELKKFYDLNFMIDNFETLDYKIVGSTIPMYSFYTYYQTKNLDIGDVDSSFFSDVLSQQNKLNSKNLFLLFHPLRNLKCKK